MKTQFKFNPITGSLDLVAPTVLSDDPNPTLSGDLDLNGFSIVTPPGIDLPLQPGAGGKVLIDENTWPATDGAAGQILETDGAGNLSWVAPAMAWTRVVGDAQALAVQNGYIPTNVALTTFTLPANSAVGDVIKIDGESAAFFKIAQNADQQIHVGVLSSTVGIGGSVTATHRRDCITLRCTVANLEWIAEQWNGNPDVA